MYELLFLKKNYESSRISGKTNFEVQRWYTKRYSFLNPPEKPLDAAKKINLETGSNWFVIKAQVHAGGRGKGGGIKLAKSYDEVKKFLVKYWV